MKTRKKTRNRSKETAASKNSLAPNSKLPFAEHIKELRRRLYYIAGSIILGGGAVYALEHRVVDLLLRPAHGEHFIYTTPGGGIDFLFRICVYGGIVLSLPIIVYNILRFIEPLITEASSHFILLGSFISGLLAITGMIFGYFVGLPAALHFLLNQFQTVQIRPLVTIQSYLGFVIVYMVGSALLFQLPLLLIFINRIKPLKPRRLLHYERWVILAAFVLAGLMNPSPNILSQLLVAGPFIIMYQLGIVIIACMNRSRKLTSIERLHQYDQENQTARHAHASNLRPLYTPAATLPKKARSLSSKAAAPRRQSYPLPQLKHLPPLTRKSYLLGSD